MSSGFSIKTLETKAVVPNKVPRIVCGRTNFQIAPINASILSSGEAADDEAAATRALLFDAPENAFVLIFRLLWLSLLLFFCIINRDDDDDDDKDDEDIFRRCCCCCS